MCKPIQAIAVEIKVIRRGQAFCYKDSQRPVITYLMIPVFLIFAHPKFIIARVVDDKYGEGAHALFTIPTELSI
jgi:hypothetical protein